MKPEDFEWITAKGKDYLHHTPVKEARGIVMPPGTPDTMGVDPGRNFGICIISEGLPIELLWGTMPKGSWEDYGVQAYHIGKWLGDRTYHNIFIEGPAHGKGYSQAGLAYVRWGFYMGYYEMTGQRPEILPPTTARKVAFGHGFRRAEELWPLLNKNAADAVGIALAGAEITLEVEN